MYVRNFSSLTFMDVLIIVVFKKYVLQNIPNESWDYPLFMLLKIQLNLVK